MSRKRRNRKHLAVEPLEVRILMTADPAGAAGDPQSHVDGNSVAVKGETDSLQGLLEHVKSEVASGKHRTASDIEEDLADRLKAKEEEQKKTIYMPVYRSTRRSMN